MGARPGRAVDGSSLGKIEIIGPDTTALADFHSYNRLSTLKPGMIRDGFRYRKRASCSTTG